MRCYNKRKTTTALTCSTNRWTLEGPIGFHQQFRSCGLQLLDYEAVKCQSIWPQCHHQCDRYPFNRWNSTRMHSRNCFAGGFNKCLIVALFVISSVRTSFLYSSPSSPRIKSSSFCARTFLLRPHFVPFRHTEILAGKSNIPPIRVFCLFRGWSIRDNTEECNDFKIFMTMFKNDYVQSVFKIRKTLCSRIRDPCHAPEVGINSK